MADVTIDPQNSNSKELFGQGMRAYVLQDFDTAVRAFSRVSELLSAEHGSDTHDSLGDVYLYYGKSLLELSRRDSGPLGDGVLKNIEEESESEEVVESEGEDENAEKANETGEGNKDDEAEGSKDKETGEKDKVNGDAKDTEKTEEDTAKSEDTPAEQLDKEESKPAEQSDREEFKSAEQSDKEEASKSTEKKEGEDAEDLQVAWEVLELAKSIFKSRAADGRKNLAETLIVLGEVSLECGNFPSAVEDIKEGLEIQKTIFGSDSRTIAETYYKLGGALSTNGQIDEAIESFNSSSEYLNNKLNNLKKDEEHKEANADEIEELNNLIPEVQEKITDMKSLKTEVAKKVTSSVEEASSSNGNAEASSSSKRVNDISHLVKRKRKEEEETTDENPAKKPSP